MSDAEKDAEAAEAGETEARKPRMSTSARLDRIEKVLGIGVSADEVAAERAARNAEMVEAKQAAQEAERKRLLKASAA